MKAVPLFNQYLSGKASRCISNIEQVHSLRHTRKIKEKIRSLQSVLLLHFLVQHIGKRHHAIGYGLGGLHFVGLGNTKNYVD